MRIPRIFIDADLVGDQPVALPQAAAKHLGKVLRLPAGAELRAFNGKGGEWRSVLSFVGGEARVTPQRFEEENAQSPLKVTLLQGIGRGERMDYAIQKAVELGVTAIQPVFTERTVVKLNGPRLEKRLQHWQGVIVAACEQSGRNLLPQLLPVVAFKTALALPVDHKLILAPSANQSLPTATSPDSVGLLIGPEGGLSDAEIELATAQGWQPWQLGPRVLRTETAGSAALAVLQSVWGDLA